MKWAEPSSLAPFLVAPVTGNFVSRKYTWSGNASIPQNRVYYMPFYLPAATYDRILLRSATQQSGSATARLGLYNVGSDGRPSTVAFDAGTVAVNAADTTFSITINETLSAGYYYIAVASQSATTLWVKFGTSEAEPPSVRTSATFNHQYAAVCFYQENVSGAFATAGTLVNTMDDFGVGLRFA